MNKPIRRTKYSTAERRWCNMVNSSNDIDIIGMIAKIQEHKMRDMVVMSKMFAFYYSDYLEAKEGYKAAKLAAMTRMLLALDNIGAYWNSGGKA